MSEKPWRPRRSVHHFIESLAHAAVRWLSWIVMGTRVFRRHRLHEQTRPFVVLANHQSYLDPPLVGAIVPQLPKYMARSTLFKGPLKPLIEFLGAFPIDREGREVPTERVRASLDVGRPTVMFGEGTRSQDGEMQPMQSGVVVLARRVQAGVLPIVLDGPYRMWPRGTSPLAFRVQPLSFLVGETRQPETLKKLGRQATPTLDGEFKEGLAWLRERQAQAGPGLTLWTRLAVEMLLGPLRVVLGK